MSLRNIFIGSIVCLTLILSLACAVTFKQSVHRFDIDTKIDFEMAEKFRKFLLSVRPGSGVQIHIESFGGLVIAHNKIVHYLKQSPAYITCTVDAYAASAAANIFMVCPNKVILDRAMLAFHVSQICVDYIALTCSKYQAVSPYFHPAEYYRSIELLEKIIKPYLTDEQWQLLLNSEDLIIYGEQINAVLNKK